MQSWLNHHAMGGTSKPLPTLQTKTLLRKISDPEAHLDAGLGSGAPLHLTSLGAVDVVRRDPVSVVSGGRRHGGSGRRLDRLILLRGARRLSRGLSRPALLREIGRNPNGVKEINDTGEAGKKEEVEEDAVHPKSVTSDKENHAGKDPAYI